MGCDESKGGCNPANVPQREVKISSFRLCRFEVTQILWQSVMGYNPSFLDGGRKCDMCPVEYISYMEIQEFIKRLKKRTGKQYRLPTEAEWEYAARGGIHQENTLYAGSNNVSEVAWILSERNKHPQPVGKKKPNSLSLHDMTGNVWEWCEDNWHSNYEDAPSKGAAWSKKGFENYRVYRGGSWLDDADHARLDFRDMDDVKTRNHILGFRLAEDI
jgi:formylglycine-generating enzyme required for sulfatase activity